MSLMLDQAVGKRFFHPAKDLFANNADFWILKIQ